MSLLIGSSAMGGLSVLVVFLLLWGLSLRLSDSSIVDVAWGPGFFFLALVVWKVSGQPLDMRRGMMLGMVGLWGIRLGAYLAYRNWGRGEDRRYLAMRNRHGERWPLRSLVIVFFLQGFLLWLISWPVQVAVVFGGPEDLGVWDGIGLLLYVIGLGFEVVADWQLARFRARETDPGALLISGVWRYSRHPNYFGEALLWWGIGLVACSAGGVWWCLIGPGVLSFLLLRVSGVPMLEATLSEEKPGYADYVRRTNAFVPWFPR
jgi:steroid 5-alpha reductase family enzyme